MAESKKVKMKVQEEVKAIDNVPVTCEYCLAGIPLDRIPVRPDIEVLREQTRQETEFLKYFLMERQARDETVNDLIKYMQDTWSARADCGWFPKTSVFLNMLERYSPDTIYEAIALVAPRVSSGYLTKESWLPYMYGVLKNIAAKSGEEESSHEQV
jgi:hypothetical protein